MQFSVQPILAPDIRNTTAGSRDGKDQLDICQGLARVSRSVDIYWNYLISAGGITAWISHMKRAVIQIKCFQCFIFFQNCTWLEHDCTVIGKYNSK